MQKESINTCDKGYEHEFESDFSSDISEAATRGVRLSVKAGIGNQGTE